MRKGPSSLFAAVLLIGGCPKRHTTSRLVYVPPPAPAATPQSATTTETLVIEEPAPPEPESKPSATAPTQESAAQRARPPRRRTTRPDAPAETEQSPAEPPAADVPAPALEPLGTLDQQANLRREIAAAQEGTQKRIAQLEGANLAIDDRKTLGDARAFLAQSTRALENGELERAHLLAHKAALLVQAVEQSH